MELEGAQTRLYVWGGEWEERVDPVSELTMID